MAKEHTSNFALLLDEAEKLLGIIEAYFDTTLVGFDLTFPELQALHRRADDTLTQVIKNVPYRSPIQDKLHDKKVILQNRITYLGKTCGYVTRKRRTLPELNLDLIKEQIQRIREGKKVA